MTTPFTQKVNLYLGDLSKHIIGISPQIANIRELVARVSTKDVSVLILGESGTGKEIIAQTIHNISKRNNKNFVPINCGAIPAELLESEMFGHEKGAFTGALAARQGRFEIAQNGTLFLDEIGDMPLNMQVKLLRVLQEKSYERVGSNKTINADVRIIAATHRNLESEIDNGNFREDLYYRLNVFPIQLPALRDRKEDIPFLVNSIINNIKSHGGEVVSFSKDAIVALMSYSWPGNIRELANFVERMIILKPNSEISITDLPEKIAQTDSLSNGKSVAESMQMPILVNSNALPNDGLNLKYHIEQIERDLIQQALVRENGIVSKSAKLLQLRRTTLVEKMKKYNINK